MKVEQLLTEFKGYEGDPAENTIIGDLGVFTGPIFQNIFLQLAREDVHEVDFLKELWNKRRVCRLFKNHVDGTFKRIFAQAVGFGFPESKTLAAFAYFHGIGMEESNTREAFELFKQAAEQGHIESQYQLGMCYKAGYDVAKNREKADEWIRKAAEQGHVGGLNWVTEYYVDNIDWFTNKLSVPGISEDRKEAIKWLTKAAENGNGRAQYRLGTCYLEAIGVDLDFEKAFKLLVEAAGQDPVEVQYAQYEVACLYLNGTGTGRDVKKGVEWMKKSAKNGDTWAQVKLGDFYRDGEHGCPQDDNKAYKWYRRAADNEDDHGEEEVGKCYLKGIGIDKNPDDAVEFLVRIVCGRVRGARHHESDAYYQLGMCCLNGVGYEQDSEEAFKFFTQAASLGHVEAQNLLKAKFNQKDARISEK